MKAARSNAEIAHADRCSPRFPATSASASSSSRRRPRRWTRRCGTAVADARAARARASSRSPMARAARPASAPTPTVARIVRETGIPAAAHLTCVDASQREIDEVARAYWDAGVRHIVALRGDPPAGGGRGFAPHPEGYANAAELVAGLKRIAPFEISVAAYPEAHPDSARRSRRSRQPQAQARCRGEPRDHPVLLRARRLLPLPRQGRCRGHRRRDRARASCR